MRTRHLRENVIRGAVEDADHLQHIVSGELMLKRLNERDAAAYSGFEMEIETFGSGDPH